MSEAFMEDVIIRPAVKQDLQYVVQLLANDPLGSEREKVSDPPTRIYVDAFEAWILTPAMSSSSLNGRVRLSAAFNLPSSLDCHGWGWNAPR